jgi:hypothetical protein
VTVDKFRIDLPMDGFPSDGVLTTTILAADAVRGAVHPIIHVGAPERS